MEKPQNYLSRLRRHPLLWNLALIAAIILAMAVAAHILMQLGTRHGARRTVPDFSGVPLDQAQRIARKHDLQLHTNDSLFVPAYEGGIVLDQLPEGGVEVKPGRTVYITINSFRQKMVPVPYVAGRSLRQAKNMLEIAGLEIAELVYRPDMATNYVLEEHCEGKPVTPTTRMEAEMGSGVTLYVGVEDGYGTTIVPRLVGLPLAQAKGMGAMAMFGEKYPDIVRVVEMGGPWSRELCAGTHVLHASQIGMLNLLGEQSVGAGTRRVEALVSTDAFEHMAAERALVNQLTGTLKVQPDQLTDRVGALIEELKVAQKQIAELKAAQLLAGAPQLVSDAKDMWGVSFASKRYHDVDAGALRTLAGQVRDQFGDRSAVVALVGGSATKPALVVATTRAARDRGLNAGALVREGAGVLGGNGGGQGLELGDTPPIPPPPPGQHGSEGGAEPQGYAEELEKAGPQGVIQPRCQEQSQQPGGPDGVIQTGEQHDHHLK